MSATVSKSFTAVGVGTALKVAERDGFTYDVSGTFVGTVKIERSFDGGNSWEDVVTGITSAASGTVANIRTLQGVGALYRYQCTAFTSGTIVCLLVETPITLKEYVNAAGVTILKVNEDEVVTVKRVVKRIFNGLVKVGAGAGWAAGGGAINVGLAGTVPASQTAATATMAIPGLKVGDTITGFHLIGQIESGGNACTVDADLRKITAAAADVTDASIGAITQLSVTADAIMSASNTRKVLATEEVIAADETFYVLLTVTTAASTDVAFQGVAVEITEG